MINACLLNDDDTLKLVSLAAGSTLPTNTIWLDVNQPDDEERQWLEKLLIEDVPDEDEMDDIESSSRFRVGPDGLRRYTLLKAVF